MSVFVDFSGAENSRQYPDTSINGLFLTSATAAALLTKPTPTMKKTFTKLMAAACCFLGTTAYAQLITPELLYYKFDGSGTNVPNYASSPPVGTTNATLMGGVTQGGDGICDGTSIGTGVASSTDYVNTGWATNLGTGSWTIAWRCQGISTNATLYYIFGDATANSFRCFTNGIAGSTNWVIRGGGLTDTYINGGALMTPTFCCYVYDASLNQVRAYLNGVLVSTVAQTAPNITGTGPFKVNGYSSNVGSPAGGQLDEFRVYNRAITQAEITQLNNPFTGSFLGSDLLQCSSGDSVRIDLNNWPCDESAWSNGVQFEQDSIWPTTTGLFYVDVTGSCGTGTDTIQILSGATTSAFSASACDSYTAPSGAVHTMSGTYNDTIANVMSCDSIITITLTINNATTASITPISCTGMYTSPSGQMYMSSGTYMDTIANAAGCDSVITIFLTVGNPSSSAFSVTMCDMYMTPSGNMVMSSGTVMDTIMNASGCDSVMTINVTILNTTTSTLTPSACGSYTAPSGAMYMMSGTYMDTIPNMAGCDSIITINLTINNATASSMNASACDNYTAPSGAMYTMSGTYMDTIPNMAGCDSVITIQLTITNSTTASMNANSCGPYTAPSGAVYTMTGTYMDTIPNMAGCDSVITIALNVTTVSIGATVAGATCTATGTTAGATFQWVTCPAMTPIAGATSINYTATANGNYAVIATIGSCSDTSACVAVTGIGIEENPFAAGITLYPNPSSGNFTINLGATYSDVSVVITDLAGRTVFAQNENSTNMIPVQLDAASGTYIVNIMSGDNIATFRITKE